MTRYEKFAISLPSRAAESVRRAVKQGRAPSVSAYIAAAVEEKTTKEDFLRLLDERLEQNGGPMTAAESRWADRVLASGDKWPRDWPLDRRRVSRAKRVKRAKRTR
jgi:antitoxin ParD1/3/4